MSSKPSTPESRARARARYHARAARRAVRVTEPCDAASLERLRKQHSLISRLGEHFATHQRASRSRGESSRPCEIDFISADFADTSPSSLRWSEALQARAAEIQQASGSPAPLTGLHAVISRCGTAMAREGLPVTPGLVSAYAEWICEALS